MGLDFRVMMSSSLAGAGDTVYSAPATGLVKRLLISCFLFLASIVWFVIAIAIITLQYLDSVVCHLRVTT